MRTNEATKLELGDLGPVRAALMEIAELASSAQRTHGADDPVSGALVTAQHLLAKALDVAADPALDEGMSPTDYARLQGITLTAAYKRARKGQARTRRVPGKGLRFYLAA
jgi:hypothetical protein